MSSNTSLCGGIYGNYRIDDLVLPAPTTTWEEQVMGAGLNGLPINTSYRMLRMTWSSLEAEIAQAIYAKFAEQQSAGQPLSVLETDPYGAELANEKYATKVYTDFTIVSISPRERGLPFYNNVVVVCEVYVS